MKSVANKAAIKDLKAQYVEYYRDVPIQKYAAMSVSRDEDTIIRWRKQDKTFADAVQRAKAEWIRKKVLKTKAEFALEKLEAEIFSATKEQNIIVASNRAHIYLPKSLPYEAIKEGVPLKV